MPRFRCILLMVVVTCSILLGCANHGVADTVPTPSTSISSTTVPTPVPGKILLGIFYGDQGTRMDLVQQMERWQGKRFAVLNMFTNWCDSAGALDNLFQQQLPNIWGNGNVPLITWEPYLCSPGQTPDDVEAQAAVGNYDAYFSTWADRLKTFLSGPDGTYATADDRRVYIRLGHEMNSNWYPWSAVKGGNMPGDYIAMWKHVREIFDAQHLDATHVQWIWAVNNDDVGGIPAERYYPGDAYVNWVAIDGFNWGTSQTWSQWRLPAASYDGMLSRLRRLSRRPVALVELASSTSTTTGSSVTRKSQWISDLFSYAVSRHVGLVAWFNEDKETDWAVWGGMHGDDTFVAGTKSNQGYKAYKAAVGGHEFISSDLANPRLLTDAQFSGQ